MHRASGYSPVGFSVLDLLPGPGGGIVPSGLNPLDAGSIAQQTAKVAKTLSELKEKTQSIRAIADGIERTELPNNAILVSDVKKLIALSSKAIVDFAQVSAQAASAAPEIRDRILSSREAVQLDYKRKIVDRLEPAIKGRSDKEAIRGSLVTANVGLLLRSIAAGYEALAFFVQIRPSFLSILPSSAIGVIVDIGELVVKIAKFVAKTLEDGLNNIKKFTLTLLDILKWGSVAGGLYLLYGVLKEDKS